MLILNGHSTGDKNSIKFIEILQSSSLVESILMKMREIGLSDYYIGAGCITQTIWNYLFDMPMDYGIKDIDIVYFDDRNIDFDSENEMIHRIRLELGDIGFEIDVKNQARVHTWYKEKFGKEIAAYLSLEMAIDSWPTTATAIGIRYEENHDITVYAPYGIEDLMAGIVRANKKQITKNIYDEKARKWKEKWPDLKIVEWEEI